MDLCRSAAPRTARWGRQFARCQRRVGSIRNLGPQVQKSRSKPSRTRDTTLFRGMKALRWILRPTTRETALSLRETLHFRRPLPTRNLTGDIDIPASVTYIGSQAFGSCGKIGKNVYIRANYVQMGGWAFDKCSNVSAVYFYGNAPVTEGSWPMNPSTQAQDLKLYCTSANIASFRSSDIYNSWNNTWSGCPLAEFTP